MAILNQDFIQFEGDLFTIRFIVSDSTDITGYAAWFGLSQATSYSTLSSAGMIQKRSTGWINASSDAGCSATNVGTTNDGISVNSTYLDIFLVYSDFGTGATSDYPHDGGFNSSGNYYYELVLSESGGQCQSIVAAQGFLNVQESLFTENDYRGTYS